MSAYLIRSRPSGRKINSRACCYCRARGRAVTRAQHNIYTAGPTHIHTDTLALASTYTCSRLGPRTNTETCVHIHKQETGAGVKTAFRKTSIKLYKQLRLWIFWFVCGYVQPPRPIGQYLVKERLLNVLFKGNYSYYSYFSGV